MNIFKKWLQKRQQKKAQQQKLQQLSDTASRFRILERLEENHLLAWEPRQRRLFIEADLAALFLVTPEKWTAFIHNVHEWLYYRLCQQVWEDYFRKEELAAVRKAINAADLGAADFGGSTSDRSRAGSPNAEANSQFSILNSQLSRSDMDRIRRARRAEIAESDIEPPKVEPFEFFIVPASTEAAPEPIGVGYFEPETDKIDIAPWADVKPLLRQ